MYQKALVPLDISELAECALGNVIDLAKDGSIGEVILLNIAEVNIPLSAVSGEEGSLDSGFDFLAFRKEQLDKAKNYLAGKEAHLKSEGIKVKSVVVEGHHPAHDIVDFAKEAGADLIVMATHGYTGMKKVLLGSVAFKVLNHSHVPVLLIRPESCRI